MMGSSAKVVANRLRDRGLIPLANIVLEGAKDFDAYSLDARPNGYQTRFPYEGKVK